MIYDLWHTVILYTRFDSTSSMTKQSLSAPATPVQDHEDVSLALLYAILTEPSAASKVRMIPSTSQPTHTVH